MTEERRAQDTAECWSFSANDQKTPEWTSPGVVGRQSDRAPKTAEAESGATEGGSVREPELTGAPRRPSDKHLSRENGLHANKRADEKQNMRGRASKSSVGATERRRVGERKTRDELCSSRALEWLALRWPVSANF